MDDSAYFREQADRYGKLARNFRNRPIAERLEELATELELHARELRRAQGAAEHLTDRRSH